MKTNFNKLGLFLAVSFIGGIASVCAVSAENAVTDADKTFVKSLKKAVGADDVKYVENAVSFPLRITHNHYVEGVGYKRDKTEYIKTKEEFVAHYNDIFSADVKSAVLAQSAGKLNKSYEGLMIGRNGNVWVRPAGDNSAPHIVVVNIIN